MKKLSLATKLITLAVLTVPFVYEKNEQGGLKLRAVLYDVDYNKTEEGKKEFHFTFGGIIKDQVKAVKKIVADIAASRKAKKAEAEIDSDFADIEFSEEEEADLEATFVE